MIKFWLGCVGVLFVLAEFVLWIKNFILPLPVYILAGAFLAIASNYQGKIIDLVRKQANSTPNDISQTATLIENVESIKSNYTKSSLLPSSDELQDKKLAD